MNTFQVGKTYSTRSLCDYDCIFSFPVIKRTAKTVWIQVHGKVRARRIRMVDGVETVDPLGVYSMSPTISANKLCD